MSPPRSSARQAEVNALYARVEQFLAVLFANCDIFRWLDPLQEVKVPTCNRIAVKQVHEFALNALSSGAVRQELFNCHGRGHPRSPGVLLPHGDPPPDEARNQTLALMAAIRNIDQVRQHYYRLIVPAY